MLYLIFMAVCLIYEIILKVVELESIDSVMDRFIISIFPLLRQ